ncbi:MAG: hypothetical protein KKB20_11890 [Proteobacteria bacterium]|nr:hypothetical protein [Pseudomonadota bacterium]
MSRPEYPTTEGWWSNGREDEEKYRNIRWGFPFPEAVDNFRRAIEGREDFDPATLFVWGTMQATAILNVLKSAEERFGEAGQTLVREALNRTGYEAMDGLIKNTEFPPDLTWAERTSYLGTGLNTILYASLEKAWFVSQDRCDFHILWCPHQDRYSAFDCRVQRYFVEGMIQATEDNGLGGWTARFRELIPRGAEHCHFICEPVGDRDDRNPWHQYSDQLQKRAFDKMKDK